MTKMKPTGALVAALGLCACAPVPDQLVINEVDYDQAGVDTAEFIEIYNAGTEATELSEFSVRLINGANGSEYGGSPIALPSGTIPAGGYFVLCVSASEVPNCDLEALTEIQNGAPDAVALYLGDTLIDTLSYEGDTAGYTEGTGAGEDFTGQDESVALSLSRCDNGVDTDDNSEDFRLVISSPGEANRCDLLRINEVDYDQPGTDTAEFIELFNAGTSTIDLSEFSLLYVRSDSSTYANVPLPGDTLAPGDYYVLCSDSASEVTGCDAFTGSIVQNGPADGLVLVQEALAVEAVTYEGLVDGFGPSYEMPEDPGAGAVARCPDGESTGDNRSDFVLVDTPTPGSANLCL